MSRSWVCVAASLLLGASGCGQPSATAPSPAGNDSSTPVATTATATGPSATPTASPTAPIAPAAETASAPYELARTDNLPPAKPLTDEDWPQFRGANRDAMSRAKGLANQWPAEGPRVLWTVKLGQGYSSPAVVDGQVFLNDYDEAASVWMIRSFKLDDGKELWSYKVPKRIRPNHAITRSVPATDGGLVFSIDPKCELHCVDARDGSLVWKINLPAQYAGQIPAWYNGQCPLLDGDRLIVAPGGRAIMTALDKTTGKPIWETPNDDQLLMSHGSIMPVEIGGVKQYAYLTLKGLISVDAATGKQLWTFPWQFNTAVPTTPLPLGDGKFLLTSGYHARTVVCQAAKDGGTWSAKEVVSLPPPTEGWNSEVHTPIVQRGFVFGVGKKQRGLWTCLSPEGNELWTSPKRTAFGMGGYLLADDKFFVLEDRTGTVRMLDAKAEEYRELASATVLEGPDVWAPPVVSHGKLLIRDLTKMACLDIAAKQPQTVAATASKAAR